MCECTSVYVCVRMSMNVHVCVRFVCAYVCVLCGNTMSNHSGSMEGPHGRVNHDCAQAAVRHRTTALAAARVSAALLAVCSLSQPAVSRTGCDTAR